ncbi:MAG: hypothetical protein LBP56_00005, partial [Odoribacteraceae bacterium]|nr:hypothetical protein [Odoribacteraceae bacterium]
VLMEVHTLSVHVINCFLALFFRAKLILFLETQGFTGDPTLISSTIDSFASFYFKKTSRLHCKKLLERNTVGANRENVVGIELLTENREPEAGAILTRFHFQTDHDALFFQHEIDFFAVKITRMFYI